MHININGLREKLDLLFNEEKQYDVIAVTESKLSDNVKTEDILLDGFEEPLRKDRMEDQAGGITVYIKKGIITHRCHDLELQNIESIQHKFTLGIIYRPPRTPVYKCNILAQMTQNSLMSPFDNVIIIGDLNNDLFPDTPCHLKNIITLFSSTS